MLHSQLWVREMYTYIGIRKHLTTLFWFRYETFIYLFEFKVFRHEKRETQFLTMLTFPSDPATCGTFRRPQQNRLPSSRLESQLSRSEFKSQLTVFVFFFQIPKSSALPGMTSFTSPASFTLWGFYCNISDCHICPARAWTPALNVCT